MQDFLFPVFYIKKKTDLGKFLFAAAMGLMVSAMVSCAVDESDNDGYDIDKVAAVSASFNGKWLLDGQDMGSGEVRIDSALTFTKMPVRQILSTLFGQYTNSPKGSEVNAKLEQQCFRADYVGVSQTSRYYSLPAAVMNFDMSVNGVDYDVRLKTAEKGSVVLLQEEKNNLSVVVKITDTMLEQHADGKIVADLKNTHTLVFESDINN